MLGWLTISLFSGNVTVTVREKGTGTGTGTGDDQGHESGIMTGIGVLDHMIVTVTGHVIVIVTAKIEGHENVGGWVTSLCT